MDVAITNASSHNIPLSLMESITCTDYLCDMLI